MATKPSLDVLSPHFDAELAFQQLSIHLPYDDVLPLDNLYKARGLLPANHPEYSSKVLATPRAATSAPSSQDTRKKAKRVTTVKPKIQDTSSSPFSQISSSLDNGPTSILSRAFREHLRVKVWTRGIAGFRGTCEAYLKAFDRHLNLILYDVDEEYNCEEFVYVSVIRVDTSNKKSAPLWIRRPSSKYPGHHFFHNSLTGTSQWTVPLSSGTQQPLKFRLQKIAVKRKRHLHQFVMRGDMVAMVSLLPSK